MKTKKHSPNLGIISLCAALVLPFAAGANSVPTPKKTVAPHLNEAISQDAGEVRILVDINEYGFVTDALIEDSTNAALNQAALAAIYQWTFEPAVANGVAVPSKAIQPFYFNDGSIVMETKKTASDRNPIAKSRVAPVLSPDLKNITGEVVLQASLDSEGRVEAVSVKSSTHSELEAVAGAALAQWKFKPAIKDGENSASKVIIPFSFKGTGREAVHEIVAKNAKVDAAPVALRQPTPELTRELREQRGVAKLKLTVDEYGYVAAVDIVESSNEALTSAARDAALQWKFKPAFKDGAAVASTVVQPFSFNGGLLTADLPVDTMPEVKRSKAPKLPEALAQVQGYVKVRLNLDARGNVVHAACTKSSHDELVAPTVEAAKSWSFKPAIRDGEKVPSTVVVPFVFNERS
ncbi:energy transducer TonB [Pelagicoccus sp. SDUM812002]|uniref:energy transducer TonB n=1 Tax=Pelagicoccus sp. SDUM812002 TaxID=3041266 RepID=UPI00280DAC15|nr:energy transducer TonB [Pelagicoccus sp. SDUM812002]MDQ8187890.1 energy transducer TonB [Pelagicoccus sp. SDUM812002]